MDIGELLTYLGILKQPFGGILATVIYCIYITSTLVDCSELTPILQTKLVLVTIGLLLYYYYLYRINRLPRASRGKIGILFVVKSENDKAYEDFRYRMISMFEQDLSQTANHPFQALCMKSPKNFQHTNQESCITLLQKTGSIIIINVSYITDTLDNPSDYEITINTGIIHPTYTNELTRQFELEFSEIMTPVRKTHFSNRNKLESFSCTATSLRHVCQYIAGLAAFFAGNQQEAIVLWEDEYNLLCNTLQTISPLKEIAAILPLRLAHCHFLLAHKAYLEFWKQQDSVKLTYAEEYLDIANHFCSDTFEYHMLKAAILVLIDRTPMGISKAQQHTSRCRELNQSKNWKYSEAFLLAYTTTNPLKVYRAYRRAFNANTNENEMQIAEYIEYILKKEPEKYMLHFALALVYQYVGNSKQAKYHAVQYCATRPIESDGTEMSRVLGELLSIDCGAIDSSDGTSCATCLACNQ